MNTKHVENREERKKLKRERASQGTSGRAASGGSPRGSLKRKVKKMVRGQARSGEPLPDPKASTH